MRAKAAYWRRVATAAIAVVWLAAGVQFAAAAAVKIADPEKYARAAGLEAVVNDLRQMAPLATKSADGQKRRALVIGINEYEELTDLNKAIGDADSLEATLKDLGFVVTVKDNIDARAFDDVLDAFVESLDKGDMAFFFFSGHGVSLEQRNFLLPADMPALDAVRESRLDRYAVDAQELVDRIYERGVEIALVVLDACRDNPFPPDADTRTMRSYGGLQRMTPQKGAFVIYSAGVGQKALDRLGPADADPNSVFTRIFRPALATPGMPMVEIAKRTQVEVSALAATVTHKQEPAYYDQVVGQFYMSPPRPDIYGLVLGIDDYGGKFNLRGAINDTTIIARVLQDAGARKVVTLTNQDLRLNLVEYVWNDLVADARPGDTVFFTFSGTGYREPAPGGSVDADQLQTVLLLSGSTPVEDYQALADKEGKGRAGLDLVEPERKLTDAFFTGLMEVAARKNLNVIVLIDGCHAGGLLDRQFANVTFFGAVEELGLASEKRFLGVDYGVGSYVFAAAISGLADLNGDGFLTQRELFGYGGQNIYAISDARQNPQFSPSIEKSSAELVLLTLPPGGKENTLAQYWRLKPRDAVPGQD